MQRKIVSCLKSPIDPWNKNYKWSWKNLKSQKMMMCYSRELKVRQIQNEFMKSSILQISNSKTWRISALKVYLKLNQKVVRITLSTYDKPSLNMQKKCQIVLYLEIFNFKTFRAEILQIFELVIWKIDDFINSFWLYLTFSYKNCANMRFHKRLCALSAMQ